MGAPGAPWGSRGCVGRATWVPGDPWRAGGGLRGPRRSLERGGGGGQGRSGDSRGRRGALGKSLEGV